MQSRKITKQRSTQSNQYGSKCLVVILGRPWVTYRHTGWVFGTSSALKSEVHETGRRFLWRTLCPAAKREKCGGNKSQVPPVENMRNYGKVKNSGKENHVSHESDGQTCVIWFQNFLCLSHWQSRWSFLSFEAVIHMLQYFDIWTFLGRLGWRWRDNDGRSAASCSSLCVWFDSKLWTHPLKKVLVSSRGQHPKQSMRMLPVRFETQLSV